MRKFEVPLHVTRGTTATLKCEFDLENERLYSIKWYKGGREFFRFVPNEQPTKQRYEVQGVKVDVSIIILLTFTNNYYSCSGIDSFLQLKL